MSRTVEVVHRRVGELVVPAEEILEVGYLPGFPDAHRFVLLEHDGRSPFLWMACLDDLDLVFVVTEPRFFFPDYDPPFGENELNAIDAKDRDRVAILAIANLGGSEPALNLAAPLLVNHEARRATQVLLTDERFSMHQPLPIPASQSLEKGEEAAAGEVASPPASVAR